MQEFIFQLDGIFKLLSSVTNISLCSGVLLKSNGSSVE